MSASRLNTEQLGRAFASSADAPASRSAERRRRIVILVWCTTVALAIGAVIGLSVWQGVQEKKKLRNLDFPLQSVQLDGFISNPSGDLQMRKMNNVLMAGAVASAASLGMCADASAQSSSVQWTIASGGNGHWYALCEEAIPLSRAEIIAAAVAKGAQPIMLATKAEELFVYAQFGPTLLGNSADAGNSAFTWMADPGNTYSNWGTGACDSGPYPNNPTNNERFAYLQSASCPGTQNIATQWDDYQLSEFPSSLRILFEYSADCNADGIVDYGQILSGQLTDANSNGIPDICEIGPCPGDISGNHAVDGVDLAALLGTWGTNGQGEFNCDVDHDGIVGGTDLTIILGGWGPCPPPVLQWATVLEQNVNPAVVTDATLRNAITASGLPWRVRDNGTNIEMLLVPGGTFTMGCSPGDAECSGDESPAHQVTLTNAFYMGKTEVTQAQWTAKMGSNPSEFQGQSDSPSRPVENISWIMAQGFNTATGFRLPTEAEAEFACRARTTTARYGVLNDIAWYYQSWTNYGTQQVAGKLPNALGLYDTLGNVWEWCQDWYGPYSSGSKTNPTGPTTGSYRLLRSGGWLDSSFYCRASQRFWLTPDYIINYVGFRVARNP